MKTVETKIALAEPMAKQFVDTKGIFDRAAEKAGIVASKRSMLVSLAQSAVAGEITSEMIRSLIGSQLGKRAQSTPTSDISMLVKMMSNTDSDREKTRLRNAIKYAGGVWVNDRKKNTTSKRYDGAFFSIKASGDKYFVKLSYSNQDNAKPKDSNKGKGKEAPKGKEIVVTNLRLALTDLIKEHGLNEVQNMLDILINNA